MMVLRRGLLVAALMLAAAPRVLAGETIVLASTTSLENSGLLASVLPGFEAETGISVRVVAQGTGQALETAARGDADLVLVHDPEAEAAFIAAGHGLPATEVAWNDFVVVGPAGDPARVSGVVDVVAALRAIAAAQAPFVSRGDRSGTDALEKRLWRSAGLDPAGFGGWYRDIGGGMGAALNAAAGMEAYTLADRGTWLSFGRRAGLRVVVEGDRRLLNRYNVILLNPVRHAGAKHETARRLAVWLAGPGGQAAIGAYRARGFHPVADAKP